MNNVYLNIVANAQFQQVYAEVTKLKEAMLSLQKTSVGGPFTPANVAGIRQAQAAFDSAVMSTRAFTMEHVAMTNSVEKFGKQLSAGKLGLGNYYKIWRDSARGVSAELDALAISQARLNRSIAIADPLRPGYAKLVTDINGVVTAQEKAIFYQRALNTALLQGSTKLIDFGKNMQWAGRQMMVGLTMPLAMFGAAASHMFLNFDKEMNSMLKVYGSHAVVQSQQTLDAIRKQVTDLASNLARTIGVTMTDTATIAKTFSSIGLEGKDLVRTTEATARLMRLGDIEAKNAGTAMVSLQNVFKLQSDQMADAVNFLNAAKHSTSTTMQDIIEAIPRVGPILQQMGGTYRDFVTLLVGMRESGVPAAQAANAMKSMFASIENPTRRAVDLFNSLKINLKGIVEQNQNNPLQMVLELQKALDTLPSLQRRQAIENLFGKFQFARVEALLSNLGKTGSQTEKVLELYGKSTGEIAAVAKQEIDVAAKGSPAANFLRMKATLQADLMPIGRQFLDAITTIGNAFDKILKVFKALGPVTKFLVAALTFTAVMGPVIMLVGLFSNLAGQIFKAANYVRMFIVGANAAAPSQNRFLAGIQNMRNFYQDLDKSTIAARNQMELMPEAITSNAEAFEILRRSIQDLTEQFLALGVAQREAMMAGGGVIPGFPRPPGFAGGIVGIPGTGSGDTYPAMLTPGESVMTVEATKQFGPTLQAMNAGVIPGFQTGFIPPTSGLRTEYLGTPGKYSAPSALSGAGRYILSQAGELESGISIIRTAISQFNESVMQGTGAFAHLTEAQRENLIITERQAAAMTQADLAHAQSASWMGRQKVWRPEELYGAYGVENNPLRRFSGTGPSAQFFGRYLEEGKNQLIQAGVATEEELTRVANQIRQGMHPLTTESVQLVNAAYTAIQRDVENATLQIGKVTSLNAGTIAPAAYKEAVIGSRVSSARLAGQLTRPEQLISLQAAAEQSVIRMQESVAVGMKEALGIHSLSAVGTEIGTNFGTAVGVGTEEGLAKGAAGIEEESALIGQKIKAGLEEGAAGTGKPRLGMGMRMGGSMGVMMGGSMLGSSIGGTTGSAISTSAMIGSMGMMMGASVPVVGALFALGAAIPLVTNSFKKMAEDNRIAHNSMMSSLKMSANAAAYFHVKFTPLSDYDFSSVKDSLEQHKKSIQENKDAIDKLTTSYRNASDQETKDLIASVKNPETREGRYGRITEQQAIQKIINKKYLSDISGGLTAQQAKQDVVSILRAAGRSGFEIQKTAANLPKETIYAGSTAVGKQDVSTAATAFNQQFQKEVGGMAVKGAGGVLRSDTNKARADVASELISGLASTDPMHMKAILDSLSPLNSKLLQTKEAFQAVATKIAGGDAETIKFANTLRKGGVSTQNMSLALVALALKAGTADGALTALAKGNFQKWLDDAIKKTGDLSNALNPSSTTTTNNTNTGTASAPDYSKMYEPYTRQYEDLISLMKKRVDAQKAYNDELKRTQEYHNKQLDFFNQFKDAMTSGNYLKAIQAQQGAVANQANFNSELKQSKEERLLSYVESRKALIEQAIQRGIAPAEFLKQNKGFHLNIDSKYMTQLLGGVSRSAYAQSLNSYNSQLIALQNHSLNETSSQTFQNLVINVDTSNSVVPDQFAQQIINNVTGIVSNVANKNNVSNSVTSGSSSRGTSGKVSPSAGGSSGSSNKVSSSTSSANNPSKSNPYTSSADSYSKKPYTSSADSYKQPAVSQPTSSNMGAALGGYGSGTTAPNSANTGKALGGYGSSGPGLMKNTGAALGGYGSGTTAPNSANTSRAMGGYGSGGNVNPGPTQPNSANTGRGLGGYGSSGPGLMKNTGAALGGYGSGENIRPGSRPNSVNTGRGLGGYGSSGPGLMRTTGPAAGGYSSGGNVAPGSQPNSANTGRGLGGYGSSGPGLMKNTGAALGGYNAGRSVSPGSQPNTANTGSALGGYNAGGNARPGSIPNTANTAGAMGGYNTGGNVAPGSQPNTVNAGSALGGYNTGGNARPGSIPNTANTAGAIGGYNTGGNVRPGSQPNTANTAGAMGRYGSSGPGLMKNTGPAAAGYSSGGNVAPGSQPNNVNTSGALGGYNAGGNARPGSIPNTANTAGAMGGYNTGGNVRPGSQSNTVNTGEALGGYSSGSMDLPYNWSSIISRARAGYPKDVDYDALYNRSNG